MNVETSQLITTRDGSRQLRPKELFEALYCEIHSRAENIIRSKHKLDPGSPTSLVHEAFLRLHRSEKLDINDEAHFLALASMTMRRIIVDRAKSIRAARHGAGTFPEPLKEDQIPIGRDPDELIAIDEALDRIAVQQPRASHVGELLVFAALGVKEAAALLGVSRKTIQRDIDLLATEFKALGYGSRVSA